MAARPVVGDHRAMRVAWIVAVVATLATGCGTSAASPPERARPVDGDNAVATAPAESPTPAPEGTAPPELTGRWRRAYEGAPLFLTLDGNGYSVQAAGGTGSGRIFVEGDLITFSNSNRCEGIGTYRWSFENDRLRFTPVDDDPCGRADFLPLATFGRVEP